MVLKDVYCVKCRLVQEVFCDRDEETCEAWCKSCEKSRQHISCCNGGTGRRYRFMDMDFDPTGYIEHMGVKCGRPHPEAIDTPHEADSATPDRLAVDNGVTHELDHFQRNAIDERRRERQDKRRSREGKAPLYFGA